ncbi:MAG: TadE family protein [Verrucomicrobiia bacterium]
MALNPPTQRPLTPPRATSPRPRLASLPPSQRGQAALETAFILTIFLLIAAFGIQVALISRAQSLLNLAAFYAAREYATTGYRDGSLTAAVTYLSPLLIGRATNPTLSFQFQGGSGTDYGAAVGATVSIDYRLLLPILRPFFERGSDSSTIKLSATAYSFVEGSD